jgi:hypothetical protein
MQATHDKAAESRINTKSDSDDDDDDDDDDEDEGEDDDAIASAAVTPREPAAHNVGASAPLAQNDPRTQRTGAVVVDAQ